MSELPLADSLDRLVGRTIASIDASCCNNVQFNFTDGTSVALHIEVDGFGLPELLTCTHCVEPVQKFYTDYPFTSLGDTPGKEAPIREIELIAYDQDKYVTVKVVGTPYQQDIKSGYIYTSAHRCGTEGMTPAEYAAESDAVRAAIKAL